MINFRFKYPKGRLVSFLLTASLVWSLFSIPGAVSQSSFQLQKCTTESLWSAKYKSSSVYASYYSITNANFRELNDVLLKGYELGLRLKFGRLVHLKIGHLANQFAAIKPIISYRYAFESLVIHQDKPAIA